MDGNYYIPVRFEPYFSIKFILLYKKGIIIIIIIIIIILLVLIKHRPCPLLDSILVGECRVCPSNMARNIGVVFDQTLSLDKHLNLVCKSTEGILLGLGST